MEKLLLEKYNAFDLLQRTPSFIQKWAHSENELPQMPQHQIKLFLRQAMSRQKRIIVQMNETDADSSLRECSGIAKLSPNGTHVVLSSKNTYYLCNTASIRHIRLER